MLLQKSKYYIKRLLIKTQHELHMLNGRIIRESTNKVNVITIKKVNFKETVDYLKSF